MCQELFGGDATKDQKVLSALIAEFFMNTRLTAEFAVRSSVSEKDQRKVDALMPISVMTRR